MATSEAIFLTLRSIFNYLNAGPDSRSIVEGEQILNAGHLILCGITAKNELYVEVFALCLQTSALKSVPHEISGTISLQDVTPTGFKCTCKAGLSGTCKHVSSVLLKCNRQNVLSFEMVSSTDVQCYWKKNKQTIANKYDVCPILETECIANSIKKQKICRKLTDQEKESCINELLNSCPESSFASHKGGHFLPLPLDDQESISPQPNIEAILSFSENNVFLENLELKADLERACCKKMYDLHISNCNILYISQLKQRSDEWYRERRFRITGSTCYSIFTYRGQDWTAKAKRFFWPKHFVNKYVLHGIKYEDEAKQMYKYNNKSLEVQDMGFFVCKTFPWLGFSPDGVIFENGVPSRLLEIKCPYIGKECNSAEFIHHVDYLIVTEIGLKLKTNHPYYAQCQLGMALLNLKTCDFIIYSSKCKTFMNIAVQFDEIYAGKLITKVTRNFFYHMLHVACNN